MDTTLHVDAQVLAMVAGLVIPLLTGVVTKLNAGSPVKSVSTAVLAVVTGAVTVLIDNPGTGLPVAPFLYATFQAFVVAIAAYYGFWKPTGVSGAVQGATKDMGIGRADPSA